MRPVTVFSIATTPTSKTPVRLSLNVPTPRRAKGKMVPTLYIPNPANKLSTARVAKVKSNRAAVRNNPQPVVSRAVPSAVGTVTTNPSRQMRVSHRELIQTVTWDSSNTNVVLRINPRNGLLFPWLSQIARAFDMYRIVNLSFEYVPSCPSTTAGQITMAIDYDVKDANTSTTSETLQSYAGAVTSQVYIPCTCYYDEDRTVLKNHKYFCNSGTVTDRLNDVGNFVLKLNVAATTANGTKFGSVFARYDVDFSDPEITATSLTDAMILVHDSITSNIVTATNLQPFGEILHSLIKSQMPGFDDTKVISEAATTIGTVYRIVSGAWEMFQKAAFTFVHADMKSLEWHHIADDGVMTDGVGYPALPDGNFLVIPPTVGDFIVEWELQGLWAPTTTAAPCLEFAYTGCNTSNYDGVYRACPLWSTSVRVMSGNQDLVQGFRLFHKQVGTYASITPYFNTANGTWSGCVDSATELRVMAAPTLTISGWHED